MSDPKDSGSDRVGPIIFSVDEAREQLEAAGTVLTFRASERTTGETWYRYSRTGAKQGDVSVEKVAEIDPAKTADLRPYARDAGFQSAEDWIKRIREVNGGELRPGYLYRATLINRPLPDGGTQSSGSDQSAGRIRWSYAIDHAKSFETRHEVIGEAAIINRRRDSRRRGVTVWAYPECDCDESVVTIDHGTVCERCKAVIA